MVSDPDSGPLSEGGIELWCPGASTPAERLSLNLEGVFAGPACGGGGETCARLVHPLYRQTSPWSLVPGRAMNLEAAGARRVGGIVYGGRGQPLANARVSLRVLAGGSPGGAGSVGTSDLDGRFDLAVPALRPCDSCDSADAGDLGSCLEAGRGESGISAILRVQAAEHGPLLRSLSLEPGAPALDLSIDLPQPGPVLRGTVLDADGGPFRTRARVLARSLDDPEQSHAARVDAQGRFRFDALGSGRYELRAIRDGLEVARTEAEAGDEIELRSELRPSVSELEIAIVDARGLPGAGRRVDGGPFRGAITDIDGRVVAPDLVPGVYTLRIERQDCEPQQVEIEAGPPPGGDRAERGGRTVILKGCSVFD